MSTEPPTTQSPQTGDPEPAQSQPTWFQPPMRSKSTPACGDGTWQLHPPTKPRLLVGATDARDWLPPAQPATQVTNSAPVRTFVAVNQVCPRCGGQVDWDGYCQQCGAKAPSVRDRFEEAPAPWLVGISDRGLRHGRNEDAMAIDAELEPGSMAILVACDGVSNSKDSDVVSMAAAQAAAASLRMQAKDWQQLGDPNDAGVEQVIAHALAAASQAVLDNCDLSSPNPASCTLVAAIIRNGAAVVANVGDSRAYWVPDQGEARQLSVDDSVAQEQITLGVQRDVAESGIHAHVITRWLGRDAPPLQPHLAVLGPVTTSGWLVVCTDGLWNYASEPQALASVVREALHGRVADPGAGARELVDWANAQGGQDNITVLLARMEASQDPLDVPTTKIRSGVG